MNPVALPEFHIAEYAERKTHRTGRVLLLILRELRDSGDENRETETALKT